MDSTAAGRRGALALGLCGLGGWAARPAAAQQAEPAAPWVTVVVELRLESDSGSADALGALADMRELMKRQPGFVSEQLLRNLNPDNAPQFVHLSRWATMAHWAALFRTNEFAQLHAHGNAHYRLAASAFMAAP